MNEDRPTKIRICMQDQLLSETVPKFVANAIAKKGKTTQGEFDI